MTQRDGTGTVPQIHPSLLSNINNFTGTGGGRKTLNPFLKNKLLQQSVASEGSAAILLPKYRSGKCSTSNSYEELIVSECLISNVLSNLYCSKEPYSSYSVL